MHQAYPKWTLSTDKELKFIFRLGRATRHNQLCFDIKNCIGGGQWVMNQETKEIWLHGHSDEFGWADINKLKEALPVCEFFQKRFPNWVIYFTDMTMHTHAIEQNAYQKIYPL